jgi:hypothetical protein
VNGGYTGRRASSRAADRLVDRPAEQRRQAIPYPQAHDPGPKTLLGRRYEESGVKEAEAALAALARHPATARHIAFKLARHFVADRPPPRCGKACAHLPRYRRRPARGDGRAPARAGALDEAAGEGEDAERVRRLDLARLA